MSKNIKINLDLGNGLKTENNKLCVDFEPNSYIRLDTDPDIPGHNGLHVSNLNGEDGAGGKSTCDNWTLVPGNGVKIPKVWSDQITNFLDVNRDVITCIFSMGLYRISNRRTSSPQYTSNVKDVRAMCNEIDAPSRYCSGTYYRPWIGDIIQLVEYPSLRYDTGKGDYSGQNFWCESLRREGLDKDNNRQKTRVMFVITGIEYGGSDGAWINSLSLQCIYSKDVGTYVVGNTYTGSYDFSAPYV